MSIYILLMQLWFSYKVVLLILPKLCLASVYLRSAPYVFPSLRTLSTSRIHSSHGNSRRTGEKIQWCRYTQSYCLNHIHQHLISPKSFRSQAQSQRVESVHPASCGNNWKHPIAKGLDTERVGIGDLIQSTANKKREKWEEKRFMSELVIDDKDEVGIVGCWSSSNDVHTEAP